MIHICKIELSRLSFSVGSNLARIEAFNFVNGLKLQDITVPRFQGRGLAVSQSCNITNLTTERHKTYSNKSLRMSKD